MNQLKVMLWGEELGRLVWDQGLHTSYFMFNPNRKERPDAVPLKAPVATYREGLPIYGDDRRIYQNLPPFIADSLPDSWGNKLFDQWVKDNRIPKSQITPLYKLMFMGKRGMGALEFEPADEKLNYKGHINIKDLYELSLQILQARGATIIGPSEKLTMETLIAIGTSAGGRQMKAVVAMNKETGEMKSGQIEVPDGFQHYILKFEDKFIPTSEIELVYHEMAISAGIAMEECFPFEVEGVSHFMTKRFDRKGNEKIFMQTLAAVNPEADSYEDLMITARRLNLPEKEIIEIYRRLVFNVIANNTDDHNKNFSFLLDKGSKHWSLSPAYDLTFIFNTSGISGETTRCLSLYGKLEGITKQDLLEFARDNNIRNADSIIREVMEGVRKFPMLSEKYKIPEKFSSVIWVTINKNLRQLGFIDYEVAGFITTGGDTVKLWNIHRNSKGIYDLRGEVNGTPVKRFVKPNDREYSALQKLESGLLDEEKSKQLLERALNQKTQEIK